MMTVKHLIILFGMIALIHQSLCIPVSDMIPNTTFDSSEFDANDVLSLIRNILLEDEMHTVESIKDELEGKLKRMDNKFHKFLDAVFPPTKKEINWNYLQKLIQQHSNKMHTARPQVRDDIITHINLDELKTEISDVLKQLRTNHELHAEDPTFTTHQIEFVAGPGGQIRSFDTADDTFVPVRGRR